MNEMRKPEEILSEALQLPSEARAALAAKLLDSLDGQEDADAEAAWLVEIERRLAEVDDGTVKTVPWHEARRRILAGGDGETPSR